MKHIKVYTTPWCIFCRRAKKILNKRGVDFEEINVSGKPDLRQEMEVLSGGRTVPQIFIGGNPIGGCNELEILDRQGKLDIILENSGNLQE